MPRDQRDTVERARARVARAERELAAFSPNGEISAHGAAARLRLGHARADLDRAIAAAGALEGEGDE